MIPPKLLSFLAVLKRHVTGSLARRVGCILLLAVVGLSSGIRVRSYLLTRRIQAVLTGLQQLKIDTTKEEEISGTVPYLVRDPHDHRCYRAALSNEEDQQWIRLLPRFVLELWPPKIGEGGVADKWNAMDLARKAGYIMGWRHLSFSATVTVLDGRVSKVDYHLEPDVFMGWPKSYMVTARSAHGFWRARHLPVPVGTADDESPYYRFGFIAGDFSWISGEDTSIGVAYTPDAPREKISHIYQVDLSCFWNFRGCTSVRQVVPLLWKDRQEILEATAARFTPNDPCPDRVLAGRVRSLPDLNIALLEVVRAKRLDVNTEGDVSSEIVVDYRQKEAILGNPEGPWTDMRIRQVIHRPLLHAGTMANPALKTFPRAGERFLYFSGAKFDSCRIVPATASAEAAVRGAVRPDRRSEDDVSNFWGRM